jgi:flagellar biosynthesis protein
MPDPRRAVTAALRYTGDGAPQVVAAGRDELAARILERAREAGVPVHQDPQLADSLASLALGDEVPEELWLAVAEVLAWAYGLKEGGITPNG